jgi:hypothetical protein
MALRFASIELQNDDELIMEAINSNYLAFEILSPDKKRIGLFQNVYNQKKSISEYVLSNN